MKINIYSLYLTFNKDDIKIFYDVVKQIIINNNHQNIKILHVRFHKNDVLHTIRNNKNKLDCEYITIINGKLSITQVNIYKIHDIISLFKQNKSSGINIFTYSGHSDGLHFIHRKIHLLSVKDFGYIIKKTLMKKADYIICDICLCGNIGFLNIVKNNTKYVIASPSYYSYLSILTMKNMYIYPKDNNIITFGKNIIKEYIKTSIKDKHIYKSFNTNLVLYEVNDKLLELIKIVKKYKNDYNMHKCKINKEDYYYIDVLCALKSVNYDDMSSIKEMYKSIIKYQKYINIGNNIVSKMIVILKKPNQFVNKDNEFFVR
jgi:hypothetical protein